MNLSPDCGDTSLLAMEVIDNSNRLNAEPHGEDTANDKVNQNKKKPRG